MKEIELYKFVVNNNIEYHTVDGDDIIAFIYIRDLEEFYKLIGDNILDEDGINCIMKQGYFCFYMRDICEYHDIELFDVFEKRN